MTDLDRAVHVAPADLDAELRASFAAYEAALVAGDIDAMSGWFADDERTTRFGIADEQWTAVAVRQWRRTAPQVPPGRDLAQTDFAIWGMEVAIVTTLFGYPTSSDVGRQSQTWIRTDDGWRIVHAHVSLRPVDA